MKWNNKKGLKILVLLNCLLNNKEKFIKRIKKIVKARIVRTDFPMVP